MPSTTLAGSSNDKAVGEYYYKFDQSDEFACKIAEERAKENLIVAKHGFTINRIVEQACVNEQCITNAQTHESVEGRVTKIHEKTVEIHEFGEQKLCQVYLTGNVEKYVPKIQLSSHSSLSFKHNDTFSITILSNTSGGDFFLFNLYGDTYVQVYSTNKVQAFKEITIPSKGTFRATVPEYTSESVEKIVFLHLFNTKNIKTEYSIKEMDLFLKSMPRDRYGILTRFIMIRR